jgi:hypothetical protein
MKKEEKKGKSQERQRNCEGNRVKLKEEKEI